jgi:hypothetical protein
MTNRAGACFAVLFAKHVNVGRGFSCPMARAQKKSPDPGIRALWFWLGAWLENQRSSPFCFQYFQIQIIVPNFNIAGF